MEQTDNTFRSATIICSPSEALDYGHLPLFIQCHQELGISSYALSEVVSDDLKQTICSNLAKAGLVEMTEASGSSAISFGDLFLASGNPTVLYYRQKLLNEVIPPFAGTPHSGITYRTGNSSRMILCNDYDNRKVNYSIKITGLSFDKTYLLCSIRKSAMTDQYAETEDNTLLEMLNGPEKSLEVFSEKTSLILEEALESGDICVYTLTSM